MRIVKPLAVLVLASLSSPPVQAAVLVNPDFELGTPTGAFTTLPLNSTAITVWTVTNTDIDIVGTFWINHSGARGVDLDGLQPGCLAQTFATVPGETYLLTFWLAGNPACGGPVKTGRVTAAGQFLDFTFNTTGHSRTAMGWVQKSFSFTANAASTTLEFCSTGSTVGCGPAIDDLRLDTETPALPASWGQVKSSYR